MCLFKDATNYSVLGEFKPIYDMNKNHEYVCVLL